MTLPSNATSVTDASPTTIAREALRQLVVNRLPPTPDNYARAYQSIAAPSSKVDPHGAGRILREFAEETTGTGSRLADAAALRAAVDASNWPRVKLALQRLFEGKGAEVAVPAPGQNAPVVAPAEVAGAPTARRYADDGPPAKPEVAAVPSARRYADDGPPAKPDSAPVPSSRRYADDGLPAAAAAGKAASAKPVPTPPGMTGKWRELLAEALEVGVVERFGYTTDIADEAASVAAAVRTAGTRDNGAIEKRLQKLFVTLERDTDDHQELQLGLLRVLRLLAANLTELVGSDTWLRGQLQAVNALAEGPIDSARIVQLERTLREVTFKQGLLKHSLDESQTALRDMMALFVDRLAILTGDTGEYHERLAGYAARIQKADDLSLLSDVVKAVMDDTRGVQSDMVRTRDDLLAARQRVDEYKDRIRALEGDMASLSDSAHQDELTQLLNRRGFAKAYDVEVSRAARNGGPLSLALFDVDNFKQLNDRLGHAAGDGALVHLTRIIRRVLRPTDVFCRHGGEEFVVLLPGTNPEDAAQVMLRAQRELTRHFFLDQNERVLITFSAGVSQCLPGDTRESLIARADTALYRAKQAGKNRVANV